MSSQQYSSTIIVMSIKKRTFRMHLIWKCFPYRWDEIEKWKASEACKMSEFTFSCMSEMLMFELTGWIRKGWINSHLPRRSGKMVSKNRLTNASLCRVVGEWLNETLFSCFRHIYWKSHPFILEFTWILFFFQQVYRPRWPLTSFTF